MSEDRRLEEVVALHTGLYVWCIRQQYPHQLYAPGMGAEIVTVL
jgi:hypothetical protein